MHLMKKLTGILAFLFLATGYGQDTTQITENNREVRSEQPNWMETDSAFYLLDEKEFTFTPNELGFRITTLENGKQIHYGNLRRTTDDGFYIMTSTLNDNGAAFGRFDEVGNFRALRYDLEADTVVEENFTIQDPVERRDRQRRKGDPEIDHKKDENGSKQ